MFSSVNVYLLINSFSNKGENKMKSKIVALVAAIAFFAVSVSPYALAGNKTTKNSTKTAIEKTTTNTVVPDSTKPAVHKMKKMSKSSTHHKHMSKKTKTSKKMTSKAPKDTTGTK